MKKLAIYRFLYALRHNLPVLLLYLAGGYLLSSILFTFTVGTLFGDYVWQHNIELPDLSAQNERKARVQELLYTVMTDNYNLLLCEAMLVLLVVVWLIARRLPLALPKALYVCPAGPREKLRYLRIYLTVKAVFLALLLAALTLFWTGTLILPAPVLAVQVSLTVFTVIAFSLNPDPGNRKEALKNVLTGSRKEQPDRCERLLERASTPGNTVFTPACTPCLHLAGSRPHAGSPRCSSTSGSRRSTSRRCFAPCWITRKSITRCPTTDPPGRSKNGKFT